MRNERLIQLRKKRGMTQQELAGEIGITQSMVALIESGGKDPRTLKKIRLAKFFNVTVEYLFLKKGIT